MEKTKKKADSVRPKKLKTISRFKQIHFVKLPLVLRTVAEMMKGIRNVTDVKNNTAEMGTVAKVKEIVKAVE